MSHLKVSTLVERVGRPKNRHLPLEDVFLGAQFNAEALDGLLLQTFVLHRQRPDGGTARQAHDDGRKGGRGELF